MRPFRHRRHLIEPTPQSKVRTLFDAATTRTADRIRLTLRSLAVLEPYFDPSHPPANTAAANGAIVQPSKASPLLVTDPRMPARLFSQMKRADVAAASLGVPKEETIRRGKGAPLHRSPLLRSQGRSPSPSRCMAGTRYLHYHHVPPSLLASLA